MLRMLWSPEHIDGGKVQPSAYKSDDLLAVPDQAGRPRSVSLDNLDGISQEAVDWRVFEQKRRRPETRVDLFFAELASADLLNSRPSGSGQLEADFELIYDPIAGNPETGEPPNPQHYSLLSAKRQFSSKSEKRAHINRLQAQLFKSGSKLTRYHKIFPKTSE